MRLPDRLDYRDGKPDSLGHRARCPMGLFMRHGIRHKADVLCLAIGRDHALPDATYRGRGHRHPCA